jgi:hypothetical protein
MLGKMVTLMFGAKAAPRPSLHQAARQLQTRIQGEVWLPGAPPYDEARRAWHSLCWRGASTMSAQP